MKTANKPRIILHIDFDAFYVQCARRQDPSLHHQPVGIRQKTLLATCSYEARAVGVTKLMKVQDALRLCPNLRIVDGSDLTYFRICSADIYSVLLETLESIRHDNSNNGNSMEKEDTVVEPTIEKLGMEEFWIDVSPYVQPLTHVRRHSSNSSEGSGPNPKGNNIIIDSNRTTLKIPGYVYGLSSTNVIRDEHTFTGKNTGTTDCSTTSASSFPSNFTATVSSIVSVPFLPDRNDNLLHPLDESSSYYYEGSYIASLLRYQLYTTLGFTCSIGICGNKLGAKVASNLHKPNNQTVLFTKDLPSLLYTRSLRDLPGIGYVTAAKFRSHQIVTVQELLRYPLPIIILIVDNNERLGTLIYELCQGIDPSPIKNTPLPLSMSEEDSAIGIYTWSKLVEKTKELLPILLRRLYQDQRIPHTLRVSTRFLGTTITSSLTRNGKSTGAAYLQQDILTSAPSNGWYTHSSKISRQCTIRIEKSLSALRKMAKNEVLADDNTVIVNSTLYKELYTTIVNELLKELVRTITGSVQLQQIKNDEWNDTMVPDFHVTVLNICLTNFDPSNSNDNVGIHNVNDSNIPTLDSLWRSQGLSSSTAERDNGTGRPEPKRSRTAKENDTVIDLYTVAGTPDDEENDHYPNDKEDKNRNATTNGSYRSLITNTVYQTFPPRLQTLVRQRWEKVYRKKAESIEGEQAWNTER